MVRLAALAALILFLCAGCAKPSPEEGNVAPTAAHPNAMAGMEAGKSIDMRLGKTKGPEGK